MSGNDKLMWVVNNLDKCTTVEQLEFVSAELELIKIADELYEKYYKPQDVPKPFKGLYFPFKEGDEK